jgi:hypothetical protein
VSAEFARVLIAAGFVLLLLLLRLEAPRFGAAEFDEPVAPGGGRSCGRIPGRRRTRHATIRRLCWYAMGFLFLAAIFEIHPWPHDVLYLLSGHKLDVAIWGSLLALIGAGQAVWYARWRYGYLRLPPGRSYPGAALNSLATAVIDEATFRGILLGGAVSAGVPAAPAIVACALVYAATTRLASAGANRYMLLPALSYGLLGGAVTLWTGGIGAAIVGHAITSFVMFICTGHAGQPAPFGKEPEELAALSVPPGWRQVRPGA